MDTLEFLSIGQITLDVIENADGVHGPFAGGGALYPAVASAQLGASAAVVGRVGDDFPDETFAQLSDLGLDTTAMRRSLGRTAGLRIGYSETGEETVDIQAGVGYDLSLAQLDDRHADARIIHLPTVKPPFSQEVVAWAAGRKGARVSFAPKSDLKDEPRHVVDELLGHTDALFLNEFELSLYAAGNSTREKASGLLSRGPEIVVVTQRERGSSIFTRDEMHDVDAYQPSEIRSLCGPGDTYVAAFWFAFVRGHELSAAGRFASMIATCAMSRHGLPLDRTPFETMLREPFCAGIASRNVEVTY